jgi:hypothetical protein
LEPSLDYWTVRVEHEKRVIQRSYLEASWGFVAGYFAVTMQIVFSDLTKMILAFVGCGSLFIVCVSASVDPQNAGGRNLALFSLAELFSSSFVSQSSEDLGNQ